MNKALKIVGIVASVVVVVIIGLTIFVKSYLTDARIRTFVTRTAESSLHRKVSLGAISVSIFSGISVKDFEIKEKDSNSDFVKAEAFVLKYQLLPLLSRRLVIDQLAIESPSIVIRKNADGSFNFSDITQHKAGTAPENGEKGGTSGLPVSLSVRSLRIDKARIEYSDPAGTLERAMVGLNADMIIQGKSRDVIGSSGNANIDLMDLVLKGRPRPVTNIPVSFQYGVEADFAEKRVEIRDVSVKAPGVAATISGRIVNYSTSPDIRMDLASSMLDLDSIMPPSGKAGAAGPATRAMERHKKEEKEFGPLKTRIKAEGNVAISKMLFNGITVRNLKAHYTFRNNVFTLASLTGNTLSGSFRAQSTVDLSRKGTAYSIDAGTDGVSLQEITATLAPKAKGILFGNLSAHAVISGSGSISETIKRNLKGKGSFSVKNGEIKNAPISDSLLALLGLQGMKEIPMEKAAGTFSISGGVVTLTSAIASKDLAIDETGTIGMDQKLNMGLLVKVSDRLAPKLLAQGGIARFLSEEKGWTAVPLKLTGTIGRPSYGVNTRAIGKRAGQAIQKKVGEEIFKALSGEKKQGQQPAGTKKKSESPEDLLKGFFK